MEGENKNYSEYIENDAMSFIEIYGNYLKALLVCFLVWFILGCAIMKMHLFSSIGILLIWSSPILITILLWLEKKLIPRFKKYTPKEVSAIGFILVVIECLFLLTILGPLTEFLCRTNTSIDCLDSKSINFIGNKDIVSVKHLNADTSKIGQYNYENINFLERHGKHYVNIEICRVKNLSGVYLSIKQDLNSRDLKSPLGIKKKILLDDIKANKYSLLRIRKLDDRRGYEGALENLNHKETSIDSVKIYRFMDEDSYMGLSDFLDDYKMSLSVIAILCIILYCKTRKYERRHSYHDD